MAAAHIPQRAGVIAVDGCARIRYDSIIPGVLSIEQARLPGIHADLERGKLHQFHDGIRVVLMHRDEFGGAHAPIAFIPFDDRGLPDAGKHV